MSADFDRLTEILEIFKSQCDLVSPDLRGEMLEEAISIVEVAKSESLPTVRLEKGEIVEFDALGDGIKGEGGYKSAIAGRKKAKTKNADVYRVPEFNRRKTDEDFNRFWAAVGKKVDKPLAKKFFLLVDVDTDFLIERLKEQQEYHLRKNKTLQYMPQMPRWLRERRWEDDFSFDMRDRNVVTRDGTVT